MKDDKIFIGVDLGVAPNDFKCIFVMKKHTDGTFEILDTFQTQDYKIFEEKQKEMENKYCSHSIKEVNEPSKLTRKSCKTKDNKSFSSLNYNMFQNGFFNCDNIPYGYNFAIGRCMEPATFEPKRK